MTISRNAPCPCGSGKKYKQCCGREGQAGAPSGGEIQAALQQARQLFQNGALQQTEILCRKLLAAQPDNPDANHLLGQLAHRVGKLDAALELFGRALAARPDQPGFRLDLANALFDLGRLEQAERETLAVLKRKPGMTGARFTLALILRSQGRLDDSIREYRRVLSEAPGNVGALNNLGMTLKEANHCEEALSCFEKLIKVQPDSVVVLFNTGVVLRRMERFAEAAEYFARALRIKPDYGDAHFELAWCFLVAGDLRRGWEEYGWRFRKEEMPIAKRAFSFPEWQGESLAGKSLLIWGEQGVGDEILFAEGIMDARQAGARVIVECEARLVALFTRSFPGVEVYGRENPPHPRLQQADIDYQLPMGSLARWYRPTVESFPAHRGYLKPASERVEHWKAWLASLGPGLKVGISWRSMKRGADRDSYYTELSQWGEVLKMAGVVFVNLQYGDCRAELDEASQRFGVEIHEAPGLNLKDELDDAAALTKALDLAIAPNTSVFGMAGAVGAPTWLLNLDSDWTMLGTDRVPWFPSVKVYRKSWGEPWAPLLAQVAGALNEMTRKGKA